MEVVEVRSTQKKFSHDGFDYVATCFSDTWTLLRWESGKPQIPTYCKKLTAEGWQTVINDFGGSLRFCTFRALMTYLDLEEAQ